jgi:hypothetical protein
MTHCWAWQIRYIQIYLLTAVGLSPGGSTHLHTNNTQNNTYNNRTIQITNVEEYGSCPVFANFTLAFALQLRKKNGKTFIRVRRTLVGVQYTYYQNTYTLQKTHTHISDFLFLFCVKWLFKLYAIMYLPLELPDRHVHSFVNVI